MNLLATADKQAYPSALLDCDGFERARRESSLRPTEKSFDTTKLVPIALA